MKIKIRGKFIIEEGIPMNNVKQPLEYLEIEIYPTNPYVVNAFSSYKEED